MTEKWAVLLRRSYLIGQSSSAVKHQYLIQVKRKPERRQIARCLSYLQDLVRAALSIFGILIHLAFAESVLKG